MNVEPLKLQKMTKTLAVETWLIIALFLRVLLLVFRLNQAASVVFIVTHVLALLVGVKYVINMFANKLHKDRFTPFIIFAVMTAYIGIIYLVNRLRPVSLEELPVTLLIVCLHIAALDGSAVSKTVFKLYFRCSAFTSVVLIAAMLVPSFYKSGTLRLYTSNENQAGLLYLCMFLNMILYLQLKKRFSVSYFMVLLVAAGTFVGCCMTRSRTSILCCVLAVLVYLIFKRKSKPFSDAAIWILVASIVLLPLLVVYVLPRVGIDLSVIISGRDEIWAKVLTTTFESPFTANFTDDIFPETITYGQEINGHNVLVELIWRYSLPVGVFFVIFVYLILSKINTLVGRNRFSIMLFAGFTTCLLHMCFEASLISGALDFSLYIILPLAMGFNLELKRENQSVKRKAPPILRDDDE